MERTEALQQVIARGARFEEALAALSTFPWDSDRELVVLGKEHLERVLEAFKNGALSEAEVERWANAVEGREDIGVSPTGAVLIEEAIYELANPALTEPLTLARAEHWLSRLSNAR